MAPGREVRTPEGRELAIEIAWFGVDVRYQGDRTEEGESVASTMFQTLEDTARAHERSTPDMPLVLEVDEGNSHGQAVWEHFGFEFFEWAETPSERYVRMIRSASA